MGRKQEKIFGGEKALGGKGWERISTRKGGKRSQEGKDLRREKKALGGKGGKDLNKKVAKDLREERGRRSQGGKGLRGERGEMISAGKGWKRS